MSNDPAEGMVDYLWSIIRQVGEAVNCPSTGAAEILEFVRKMKEPAE